jgi:proteasome alpha subunit
MTTPFYVSPQQVLADRAEYARKGIARGRSIVACEVEEGILIVAENPMQTLHKISEIYDRIAFAAVGRYNEFEALRVAGVRRADLTGYSYSREDVTARSLAGVYSQTLGQIFTHELKPMEVELLVAEVGTRHDGPSGDHIYRVTFDGQIFDVSGAVTMGGEAEALGNLVDARYSAGMSCEDALRMAVQAVADQARRSLGVDDLEVALLDRSAERRCFTRIRGGVLVDKLGAEKVEPASDVGSDSGRD